MASILSRVHTVGISENGSTYLTVEAYYGADNQAVPIEPPIRVVFEGEAANVAVTQGALAARYNDDELRQIGEGSSMLGLDRVIGDIAMNGNLTRGAIKPLHPNVFESMVVDALELTAPVRELTA
ncbi:MAG: hypothetical protein JWM81_758 [Candidatus Saccharibacteria bacterium]|nr:hypothetical protein [Candidatus Saccharibacteria bacterium]